MAEVRDEGVRGYVFEDAKAEDFDRSQLINAKEDSEKESKPSVSSDFLVASRPSMLWRLFPCSSKTQQWRYVNGIVAISSLGSFIWGYSFAVIGGAMLLIDDHFNLSVLWHETIVTMLVVGATVGAAIAGTLNDKFGRWKVMMTSAILHIVAAVVMALAFSEIFLVIGRAIAGLALGTYNEFYKHVNNIHTISVRGVPIIGSTKYRLSICFLYHIDNGTTYPCRGEGTQ